MNPIGNNYHAFPSKERNDDGTIYLQHYGMTLLDYFAGQAMIGSMNAAVEAIKGGADVKIGSATALASDAYMIASAMIAEREK